MPEDELSDGPAEEIPTAQRWSATPPPVPAYAVAPGYGGASAAYIRPKIPGIISMMGALSIAIACMTAGGSAMSAMQAAVKMAMVQINQSMARAASIKAVTVAATQMSPPADFGLAFDERQTGINVLAARHSLTGARLAQLDQLLSQDGQIIFGVEPGQLTSGKARSAIKSVSRGRSPRPGESGPDYFILQSGTIELYEANGVFRPADTSQPTVRVAADANRYLATVNGTAFSPLAPPTTSPVTAGFVKLDPTALAMVFSEAALSGLVAIYLLVIGILTLRGNRLSSRLHLIYVFLKLPLICLGGYGWMRLQASFDAVMPGNFGVSALRPIQLNLGSSPTTLTAIVLSLIYPLTLLFLLQTKTVRDFYVAWATSP